MMRGDVGDGTKSFYKRQQRKTKINFLGPLPNLRYLCSLLLIFREAAAM